MLSILKRSFLFFFVVVFFGVSGYFTKGSADTAPVVSGKKTAESKKNPEKKKVSRSYIFKGVLESVDLPDHPMTMTAIANRGCPDERVFGGDLSPQIVVYDGGKSVGVKALKKGEKVLLTFQKDTNEVTVVRIRILSPQRKKETALKHH